MSRTGKKGVWVFLAALAIVAAGCNCTEKKTCCGTCGGQKKAVEQPKEQPAAEKPAGEKPLDHPAH